MDLVVYGTSLVLLSAQSTLASVLAFCSSLRDEILFAQQLSKVVMRDCSTSIIFIQICGIVSRWADVKGDHA